VEQTTDTLVAISSRCGKGAISFEELDEKLAKILKR